MNIFKIALPFIDPKDTPRMGLDNVYVMEEYAYATDRYVAVRTRHHAVVPDPVQIPLATVKQAAKVKSVVTNIDSNMIWLADGTEIPFAEPELNRYPNLDRIFESFVPSAHTTPLEFDAHYLALFAKWFTRKQAQETPLHLDFNSRGVLRVRPDTDTVALVAPTRFT